MPQMHFGTALDHDTPVVPSRLPEQQEFRGRCSVVLDLHFKLPLRTAGSMVHGSTC